MLTIRCSS